MYNKEIILTICVALGLTVLYTILVKEKRMAAQRNKQKTIVTPKGVLVLETIDVAPDPIEENAEMRISAVLPKSDCVGPKPKTERFATKGECQTSLAADQANGTVGQGTICAGAADGTYGYW